MLRRSLLDALN